MGPLETYQKNLQEGVMSPDAEQLKAVMLLQSLFESLSRSDREEKNLLTKIFKKKGKNPLQKGSTYGEVLAEAKLF